MNTLCRRLDSRCLMTVAILLLTILLVAPIYAADPARKGNQPAKAQAKPINKKHTPTSPMQAALERVFKAWDLDKDGSVQRKELQKFYKSRKSIQKPAAARNQNPDLPAPVQALLQKIDMDSDDQVSEVEFTDWSGGFADYLVRLNALRHQAAAAQQRLAETKRVMSGGRNITPLEGTGNELARRAIRQCEFDLEQLVNSIKTLESEGGHSNYQAFMEFELSQRMR